MRGSIMRTRPIRWASVFTLGALAFSASAWADITTDRSASILVFPKVIGDGTRDTIIQISNTSNSLVRAHCFYVNAALLNPELPQGPLNPPLWQEIDFDIRLTKQQPTQWTVSLGRSVDPTDQPCDIHHRACEFAGLDPGRIPPVVPDFQGELKCIEVDDSGAPLSGNHFKGEATLVSLLDSVPLDSIGHIDVHGTSKYNAIGVLGQENNGDDVLVLGGGQCSEGGAICNGDDDCGDNGPCILEYNACPETWILNHLADGAPDPILEDTVIDVGGGPSSVQTELTVVPCTENFETQIPTTVTLQFLTTNEFESQFSVSTTVVCWANFRLSELGAPALTFEGQTVPDPQGTMFLQTRIRSAAGTPFGVFMVGEATHFAKASHVNAGGMPLTLIIGSRAAFNLHVEGDRPVPDLITIPADQLVP